ncbi:MAG TPA: response regulator [Kofleriaceae bacterium]|jgi:DNA-binding NtrC family response regulator|nr:response regulator [Kofleriaceae bacterium]
MTDKNVVVCVDDDPTLLNAIARALRPTGFDVRPTLSPTQALDWISSENVAVVIADYEMPEMSGAELADAARRVRPETVRILLTGRTSLDTAIDGIHRGEVFRFLTKPFEVEALRGAVRAGIDRHLELMSLSGERKRRERRELLRSALEAEYPGISDVLRRSDGALEVTSQPWADAARLGLVGLTSALQRAR